MDKVHFPQRPIPVGRRAVFLKGAAAEPCSSVRRHGVSTRYLPAVPYARCWNVHSASARIMLERVIPPTSWSPSNTGIMRTSGF
ncbi:hypothetical protein LG52_2878 [Geobacillus kaustophilus]|uniref:Uncharacterized protein n=1 Tax=Geobacillus kaustophilus TaxID=1462 RepID=A0A0D8BVU6_GEOKU|nr:hypothetical protein LG52_2878 [Geobacillus kaustophilus]